MEVPRCSSIGNRRPRGFGHLAQMTTVSAASEAPRLQRNPTWTLSELDSCGASVTRQDRRTWGTISSGLTHAIQFTSLKGAMSEFSVLSDHGTTMHNRQWCFSMMIRVDVILVAEKNRVCKLTLFSSSIAVAGRRISHNATCSTWPDANDAEALTMIDALSSPSLPRMPASSSV
jgi:hypothetical protein